MKIELHLHTHRYSPCAVASPAEMVEALIQAGYDAAFITEHDAVWSDWELEDLQKEYPAIRLFRGVEVALGNGTGNHTQHLLVLGTSDPAYVELAEDPSAVLDKARAEGCLTILAHPFRWEGSGQLLEQGLLPDAIEYCTCNQEGGLAQQAMSTAERLGLPAVNAGDSHAVGFLDRFWIETDQPLADGRDIRRIILGGQYRNCMRADAPIWR